MRFSIIVPVYNRVALIGRCVASVLTQSFADFELILVDDGSTDDSFARMREFSDSRLQVLRHEQNRGYGSARNTGIDAARGDWIILLDSDDELSPGALQVIAHLTTEAPAHIGALWFRCRTDAGCLLPPRLTAVQEWNYSGFVRFWAESDMPVDDMLHCARSSCFDLLRYSQNRMDDTKFRIDFAKQFKIRAYPDVLLLYHQDSDNSLIRFIRRIDPRKHRDMIRDRADGFHDLLLEHRDFVAREAPRLYAKYLELATTTATMANRRREAFGYAFDLLHLAPSRPRNWMLLAASLIGPRAAVLRRWMTAG